MTLEQIADALVTYAEWCGSVHDDGCPCDDTCECSGAPLNVSVTAAVNHLRTCGEQLAAKDAQLAEALDALTEARPYVLSQSRAEHMLDGFGPRSVQPSDRSLELVDKILSGYSRLRSARPTPEPTLREALTFAEFALTNRERCESPQGFNHRLSSWSTSDWMTALVGEVGEAANVIKKLNRYRDGVPGNKVTADELRAHLRKELGDVFVYLDLICQSLGFSVEGAATEVFNAKSADLGYPVQLAALASVSPPPQEGREP